MRCRLTLVIALAATGCAAQLDVVGPRSRAVACELTPEGAMPQEAGCVHPEAFLRLATRDGRLCGARADGQVACWGQVEPSRRSGDEASLRWSPTPVDGLEGAIEVTLGAGHGCVLHADGGASCWGNNRYGQLGRPGGPEPSERSRPGRVEGVSGLVALEATSAGMLALAADGAVWGWGVVPWPSGRSRPGDGERHRPHRVEGVRGARAIAATDSFACALDRRGAVSCWGEGFDDLFRLPGLSGLVSFRVDDRGRVTGVDGAGRLWSTNAAMIASDLRRSWRVDRPRPRLRHLDLSERPELLKRNLWGAAACAVIGPREARRLRCFSGEGDQPRPPLTPLGGTEGGVLDVALGENYGCLSLRDGALRCFGDNRQGQQGAGSRRGRDYDEGREAFFSVTFDSSPLICPAGLRLRRGERARWCEDSSGRRQGPSIERWESGLLRSRETWQGGLRHGPAWYQDESGALITEGAHADGRRQGSWRSVDLSGSLRWAGAFSRGRPVGDFILDDGSFEATYDEGRQTRWFRRQRGGQAVEITVDVQERWTLRTFYGRGGERRIVAGIDDPDLPTWTLSGPRDLPARYRFAGLYREYHREGPLALEGEYRDGSPEGEWRSSYEDGARQWSSVFSAGRRSGPSRTWFRDGTLGSEGLFVDGARQGLWRAWYSNGERRSEGHYERGVQVGPWELFRDNGSLDREIRFILPEGAEEGLRAVPFDQTHTTGAGRVPVESLGFSQTWWEVADRGPEQNGLEPPQRRWSAYQGLRPGLYRSDEVGLRQLRGAARAELALLHGACAVEPLRSAFRDRRIAFNGCQRRELAEGEVHLRWTVLEEGEVDLAVVETTAPEAQTSCARRVLEQLTRRVEQRRGERCTGHVLVSFMVLERRQ